jgi:hypothetical protein
VHVSPKITSISQTGVTINPSAVWQAEVRQEDGGRPDLQATDAENKPVVKIEAKLSAALMWDQPQSYVDDVHQRSGGGLLLVLVPRFRVGEAAAVISAQFTVAGSGPWRLLDRSTCTVAIVTWNEVLDLLGTVDRTSFRNDLAQFRAIYGVLSGDDPGAIEAHDLEDWRLREDYFVNIVDRVTRELPKDRVFLMAPGQRLLPFYSEPRTHFRHRYVGPVTSAGTYCSVGLRNPFDGFVTPVWMRFNFTTPRFATVRANLEDSQLRQRVAYSGKHLWIPLDIPVDSAQPVIDALIDQAREVIHLATRHLPGATARVDSNPETADDSS